MPKKKNFQSIIILLCLSLFIVITLPDALLHITGYDEAHAWMNAKFMTFDNWTSILSSEGHPILWYLLLMPFSKLNFNYPYPMLIINYFFCLAALTFMWFKAPFNNYIKVIITFSSIFVHFYSIVARNYTIGIFGLFLIAHLCKNKFEKPVLCSVIIALTFHTHILCAIGAGVFYMIMIFDVFFNKNEVQIRDKIISSAIPVLSALFFVYPYLGGYSNEQNLWYAPPSLFYVSYFFTSEYHGLILLMYTIISAAVVICIKETIPRIFYFSTTLLMLVIFGAFYSGTAHHYFMFFIYLIITIWISHNSDILCKKVAFIAAFTVLFMLPIKNTLTYIYPDYYYYFSVIINDINSLNEKPNKRLYIKESCRFLIPYFTEKYDIYDLCSYEKLGWETYSKICKTNIYDFYKNTVKNLDEDALLLYWKQMGKDDINVFDFPTLYKSGNLRIYKINKHYGFKKQINKNKKKRLH